jgi:hypothetical protein
MAKTKQKDKKSEKPRLVIGLPQTLDEYCDFFETLVGRKVSPEERERLRQRMIRDGKIEA